MDDSAGISGYYTFPRKKFVDQSVIIGELTSLFQITCIVNTSEMDLYRETSWLPESTCLQKVWTIKSRDQDLLPV